MACLCWSQHHLILNGTILGETVCTIVHFLDVAGSQFVGLKCTGANVILTYNGFTNTMTVNNAWSHASQHLHEANLKSFAEPPALPRPCPTLRPRKHLVTLSCGSFACTRKAWSSRLSPQVTSSSRVFRKLPLTFRRTCSLTKSAGSKPKFVTSQNVLLGQTFL